MSVINVVIDGDTVKSTITEQPVTVTLTTETTAVTVAPETIVSTIADGSTDVTVSNAVITVDLSSPEVVSSVVAQGLTGLSAYEIAVRNGFEGTEQEWIDSLGATERVYELKSVSFTAEINHNYFIDTSESEIDCTLPEADTVGQSVVIADYAGTFDTNPVTVSAGTAPILGEVDTLRVDIKNTFLKLIWSGLMHGWKLDLGGALQMQMLAENMTDNTGNYIVDSDGNYLLMR